LISSFTPPQNIILVSPGKFAHSSSFEFEELAIATGGSVSEHFIFEQKLITPSHFISKGKLQEIRDSASRLEIDLIIFNCDLSPSQERNLEKFLKKRVLDRTGLILDIFALRAESHIGKLQVELAQLSYLSTRLVRGWSHLERQKGGIGLRGPGETQLETDRRLLRDRIKNLNRRLARNHNQKRINRYARKKSNVFQVSLVGYTNAGKSSLFNLLTKGETYVKDQLFATLDTKTKKLASKDGYGANVIISDTVGFVSNIPTNLIESFKATLEDLENADLLLHVIDVNDEDRQQKINEVNKILQTLDLESTAIINIFNKSDELSDDRISSIRSFGNICCSAITGSGLNKIKAAIRNQIRSSSFSGIIEIPLELGSLRSRIYNSGKVFNESLTNDGHLSLNIEIENKLFEKLNLDKWVKSPKNKDERMEA
jgi:GTP-binding protein HflX